MTDSTTEPDPEAAIDEIIAARNRRNKPEPIDESRESDDPIEQGRRRYRENHPWLG